MITTAFATRRAAFAAGNCVRVVNYHATPASRRDEYARQLERFARDYVSVTLDDLDRLFAAGEWDHDKPGLIPVFYEGWRNHHDVAAPLCDELGLTAWFFVPTALVDTPVEDQKGFSDEHHLRYTDEDTEDGRVAMTWDELRAISHRHVIAAHTATHAPVDDIRTEDDIEREIREPLRAIERATGIAPVVFAWLFGSHAGANAYADDALRAEGYRYLVSNTKIQRLAKGEPWQR